MPMPSHDNLSQIIYYFSIVRIDILSIEELFCFTTILLLSIENQIPNTTRCSQILTALFGSYGAPCELIFKTFMQNEISLKI